MALYEVTIVLFLLVAVAMVALILVQQGKGAGMGSSFGAGASNTVFGAVGSGNFLTRSTWMLAVIFFAICLFISWLQKDHQEQSTSFTNIAAEETVDAAAQAPALDAAPAPLPADVPAAAADVPAAAGEETEAPAAQ